MKNESHRQYIGLGILTAMALGLTGCFFRADPPREEPRHDDRVIIERHDDHHDWHDDHR